MHEGAKGQTAYRRPIVRDQSIQKILRFNEKAKQFDCTKKKKDNVHFSIAEQYLT